MAFTLSGSTITQSGIDTNLSGLSAIAGVVTNTRVNHKTYTLEALQIMVTGTLSINPGIEGLVFGASHPGNYAVLVTNGSTLNVGTMTLVGGEAIYSNGTWLCVTVQNTPWNAGSLLVQPGGTFNWNGGDIDTASSPSFEGICNIGLGRIYLRMASSQMARCLVSGATNLSNLEVYNNGIGPSGGFTGTLKNCKIINGTIIGIHGAVQNLTIEDYDYVGQGKILSTNSLSRWTSKNTVRGTAVSNWHNVQNSRLLFTKSVSFTVTSLAGTILSNAVAYSTEYPNANRTSSIAGDDFSQILSSTIKANTSGVITFTDWRLGITYLTPQTQYFVSSFCKSQNNSDIQDFTIWEYSSLPQNLDIIMKGAGVLNAKVSLLPDVNITSTESAVQAVFDANDSVGTLDNLYDYAKFWKTRNIQAQVIYPSKTTQPINAKGTALDLGSLNVVFDSSRINTFTIDIPTNTIYIKTTNLQVGTKFKTIETTGIVTLNTNTNISVVVKGNYSPGVTQVLNGNLTLINLNELATIGIIDNSNAVQFTTSNVTSYVYTTPLLSSGTYKWLSRRYGYQQESSEFNPIGETTAIITQLPRNNTLTFSNADALTGISWDTATKTISVTEAHTVSEIFDWICVQLTKTTNLTVSDVFELNDYLVLGDWSLNTTNIITGSISTTGVVTGDITGTLKDINTVGKINVLLSDASDTVKMYNALNNSVIATRTGPGSFIISPSMVGNSVYFVRENNNTLIMSTQITPTVLTENLNTPVQLFSGDNVQLAQSTKIDLLPTLAQIEQSNILAKEITIQKAVSNAALAAALSA